MCSSEFLKTAVEIFLEFLFFRLCVCCVGCVSSVAVQPEVCVLEMANAVALVLSKGWSTRRFGGGRWLPVLKFFGGATCRDLQGSHPICVKYFSGRRPTSTCASPLVTCGGACSTAYNAAWLLWHYLGTWQVGGLCFSPPTNASAMTVAGFFDDDDVNFFVCCLFGPF